MSDVFKGPSDARQSQDQNHPVSRFRPTYRALSQEKKNLHDKIKAQAVVMEELFAAVSRDGRYSALAVTNLELAVMWAVKSLTS